MVLVLIGTGPLRSGLCVIVQEHVWDQLFTVDTIWNIGETGDIHMAALIQVISEKELFKAQF